MTLRDRCVSLVSDLGLARPDQVGDVTALTGGVASDIAVVSLPDYRVCVKFALPQLRVEQEWLAPVHRNAAEYAWMSVASTVQPEASVRLFGRSETLHGFAMEYLGGPDIYLWKSELLAGRVRIGEAADVAKVLGEIHAASTREGFDTSPFQNRDDFRALRIEPYLLFTASRNPEVAPQLRRLADMLYGSSLVLVHGDVSPKNIMFRDFAPVLLDAECATMGDPSFDPAFCLNHLVLKAVHLPTARASLLGEIGRFWDAYGAYVTWENPVGLEARVAELVPALMLARMDGKSPVEYLSEASREKVRELALDLLSNPRPRLADLVNTILSELE